MNPESKMKKKNDLLLWAVYLYITRKQILMYSDTFHASALASIGPILQDLAL